MQSCPPVQTKNVHSAQCAEGYRGLCESREALDVHGYVDAGGLCIHAQVWSALRALLRFCFCMVQGSFGMPSDRHMR